MQARAPKSPVIIVGTHGDLVTNKTEQMQSLELIEKLYGSLSHSIKGFFLILYVCVYVRVYINTYNGDLQGQKRSGDF